MNRTISVDTIERLLDASPSRLVVMLYDEAIASCEAAIAAIGRGDIETRCHSVNRALEIVCHLHATLDLRQGGEIAEKLAGLYRFAMARLAMVNATNDPEPARQAIGLLAPVRASWRALDDRIETSAAAMEAMFAPPAIAYASAAE
jgi:flagellar protein FliS